MLRGHLSFIRPWLALTAAAAAAAGSLAMQGTTPVAASVNVGPDIVFVAGDNVSGTEPLTVTTQDIVGRFIDTDNVGPIITRPSSVGTETQIPLCGDTSVYVATINWGDGSSSDGTVSCDSSDTAQYMVTPSADNEHTYLDSGTYNISITIDDGSNDSDTSGTTATATVNDATIVRGNDLKVSGTEGASVSIDAFFADDGTRTGSLDPGLSATVDWGDGTTSSGSIKRATECECNVEVTATHQYDANVGDASYTGKVTLSDDGGKSASAALTATIADAPLTKGPAKSFTMTGGQASTATVASFTDAAGAQAAAADFTASIKWGDGSTSTGTITKSGTGAFDVQGTHAYATAGTKSLTITVTDEEGQTLSMTATATVPALPATGQPGMPTPTPFALLLTLLTVLAGLLAVGIGVRKMLIR